MCPALWAPPRCRWSRCRHMCIQGLTGAAAPILTTRLRALGITHHTQIPMQPAAPSLTRTRWTARLERPPVCRHTTRWRTSCGPPNPVAGVACGAFGQTVRHCGRDHAHGGAAGQPCAFLLASSNKQAILRGKLQPHGYKCYCQYGTDRRQPASQPHALWCIWRSVVPTAVLCSLVHHAMRMIRARA